MPGSGTHPDADEIHGRLIVIDGLGGGLLRRPPPEVDGRDPIDQLRHAGLTATNQTIAHAWERFTTVVYAVDDCETMVEVAGGRALIVRSGDDIRRAKVEGRHGFILGLQGADPVEDRLENLRTLFRLGLRIMGLAYNRRNLLGDGISERNEHGLTAFGRSVIHEMNRLGMVLDLSHTGPRTSLEALAVTARPAVFSHSNVRRLCDHPRNLTDEQIRAVAATGGLVGVVPHSMFCEKARGTRPSLDDMIDHAAHIADLVGVDHVGIGTDMFWGGQTLNEHVYRARFERQNPGAWAGYDATTKYVTGFSTVADFPRVTGALLRRGFGAQEVGKITGGNFLRVFDAVWPQA